MYIIFNVLWIQLLFYVIFTDKNPNPSSNCNKYCISIEKSTSFRLTNYFSFKVSRKAASPKFPRKIYIISVLWLNSIVRINIRCYLILDKRVILIIIDRSRNNIRNLLFKTSWILNLLILINQFYCQFYVFGFG